MVAVFDRDTPSETLESSYAGVTAVVASLDDTGFLIPTRCRGLLVADLLVHMLFDAQRALSWRSRPQRGRLRTVIS